MSTTIYVPSPSQWKRAIAIAAMILMMGATVVNCDPYTRAVPVEVGGVNFQ